MSYRSKEFTARFAPFKDEPWFDALFDAYEYAQDRDDEFTIDDIQDKLIATAKKQGITLPLARCGCCDKPRADLVYIGAECRLCKLRDALELRRARRARVTRLRWLRSLSPEERAAREESEKYLVRVTFDGLFSRDVQ